MQDGSLATQIVAITYWLSYARDEVNRHSEPFVGVYPEQRRRTQGRLSLRA
ncbi:MAG TPA: hypothetical protein PKH07_08670 [bacterium]|nr:hypothetical protein [bacterium]